MSKKIKLIGLLVLLICITLIACEKKKTKHNNDYMPYFSSKPTNAVLNLEYTFVEFGSYPQTRLKETDKKDTIVNAVYDKNNNTLIDEMTIHRELSGEEYKYYYIEPIRWKIINVSDTDVILWSESVIDSKCFSDELKDDYTWSDSSLRNYLNHTFFETAFSMEEQKNIVQTNYTNYRSAFGYPMREKNKPELVIDHTDDKISIRSKYELSEFEFECPYKILGDDSQPYIQPDMREIFLKCKTSDYALDCFKSDYEGGFYEKSINYWSRTIIDNTNYAIYVLEMGSIVESEGASESCIQNSMGIRPVIVLPIEGIKKYIVESN